VGADPMEDPAVIRFLKELRRRRVLRVAGLYVVTVWLLLQAADILFPAWGIPDAAIRYLLWAGLLGFLVALAFGWVFDITPDGIRRTQPVRSAAELQHSLPLRRADYLILAAFLMVMGFIVYDTTGRVLETAPPDERGPSLAEVEPNSLAVLPFKSLSADPEHEYFADGVSEEILNRLSAFGELKVIARTSSFAFKDSGYDVARISGLLAVNYVLQGSVRRDGQLLRITAQLVDRTGVQVWSSTFDRQMGAIFALQDEIAEAVATSIVPQIVPPVTGTREPDLMAYQQFLVGREILASRSSQWYERSVAHFDRAIELDPEFAEPYAARAMGRVMGALWDRDRTDRLARAQQDIGRALALNPNLATAYVAQSLLDQELTPDDHTGREALLRRALELDPNLVDALDLLSHSLWLQGRREEALEVIHRAVRLDPLAPDVNLRLAAEEGLRGDFVAAEQRLLSLLEIPNPSVGSFRALSELYAERGRLVDGCLMAQRMALSAAGSTGQPAGLQILARHYARLGMWEAADEVLLRWEAHWRENKLTSLFRYFILEGNQAPAARWAGLSATIQSAGIDPQKIDRRPAVQLLELQALSGDYAPVITALEAWINPQVALQGFPFELSARHALVWAWLQSGERARARAMLDLLDAHFAALEAEGRLHSSGDLFAFAQNTLLLGDTERALSRLDQAAGVGWRGYFAIKYDPRWDTVREDPRFVRIMARVKAEIDVERARMEQIDAGEDFMARLDVALAARAAEVRPPNDGIQDR
jgi:TolB-like protein